MHGLKLIHVGKSDHKSLKLILKDDNDMHNIRATYYLATQRSQPYYQHISPATVFYLLSPVNGEQSQPTREDVT